MIFILNVIPWLILAMGVILAFKLKRRNHKAWAAVGAVLAFIIYVNIQPAYIPKGKPVVMYDVPAFEVKDLEVKNNLLTATPEEAAQAKLDRQLDWRERAAAVAKPKDEVEEK